MQHRPWAHLIRPVPDFPKPGILFRDITPLLRDPQGMQAVIHELAGVVASLPIEAVAGIESRGFIFGSALAFHLGVGFVPIRKPGKLPPPTLGQSYSLEYGEDRLEISQQALTPGQRVLLIDDLIATGGTAAAAATLIQQTGALVTAFAFVIELLPLGGRSRLPDQVPVHTLLCFD
ncbi:MAG: adenine phosphoribosyltransferase [Thermostichales cyanobacterium SZTDM-1c_bins_54]